MADEMGKREEEKIAEGNLVAKGKTNNKLIIAGIIAGVIVIEALMLVLFFNLTKPPKALEQEAKMRADSLKYAKEVQTSFGNISEPPIEAIVNIAGTDGMRFLKVVLVFEYDDEKYSKLGEELSRRNAKLKDLLIEQLSSMTMEEINDTDARKNIRKSFMRTVNNSLPANIGQIDNVLINEFIIQ